MKYRLPIERRQLDGVVVFLHVAELRSFRAAATLLGISSSAVSQSIRALEAKVGVPLLSRTTRTVGLTEAGERLLRHAGPGISTIASGLDAAAGMREEVSGLLRLNVPGQILPLIANRLLPDFCNAYPYVQLELFSESKLIDIVEGGFDAGIRFGELVAADMVAVRLTPPVRFMVVGTPDYFREHGHPATPRDLQQHRCIQLRMPTHAMYNWEFDVDGQPMSVAVKGPLIVNDADINLRAALLGVGLAYVAEPTVLFHLAHGRLVTTLEAYWAQEPGLMLYYPSRTQSLPKLRAFIDFARKRMRKDFSIDDYLMPAMGLAADAKPLALGRQRLTKSTVRSGSGARKRRVSSKSRIRKA